MGAALQEDTQSSLRVHARRAARRSRRRHAHHHVGAVVADPDDETSMRYFRSISAGWNLINVAGFTIAERFGRGVDSQRP
jgi:hypothetical protein